MERNRALMDIVGRKGFLGEELYRGICRTYPQFNPTSSVNIIESYQITLEDVEKIEWVASKTLYKMTGVKPRLWRAIGELLNRKTIYNRGMELDTVREIPPIRQRTLQLQQYGVTDGRVSQSLAIAYDPLTDTLFVKE